MDTGGVDLKALEMNMLQNNKEDGYNYRYRRTFDWDENYSLYRDKVVVNRLTQRQSVNLPLMKQSVRTLLKDVDDMPVLLFKNRDNNKQAEVYKNEYWKETVEHNKMELQDIVDKRQVFLFGRSFDQWQIVDGMVKMTVQDPMDILVQRYADPFDLNSSRFLIHTHIFVPLSALAMNEDYDKGAVEALKKFYSSEEGLIKNAENQKMLNEKNKKMADMGVQDVQSPVLGETYVELSLHFVYRNDEKNEKGETIDEQIFLYVEADNHYMLMKKPLEDVIGVTKDHYWRNHYPYVSWADDLERQDFWSDGVADMIRTPNKILNAWFSQLVENRTLRNLGMHYYNSNIENWNPQTNQPMAFGWYGIPVPQGGDIRTVMQKVDIPDLSDSLDEMNFVINMAKEASGASSTQAGAQNKKQVTLGEIQITLGEAKERIKGMSKFYTPAWKQRGEIFLKLIEAGYDKLDPIECYKEGRNSHDVFKKVIAPKDFMTTSGYNVEIWSQDEKKSKDVEKLEILNAVKAQMPDNKKLDEVHKRNLLEFADLSPDKINAIMDEEEEKLKAQAEGAAKQPGAVPTESMQLPYDKVPEDIKRQMEAAFGFKPSQMALTASPEVNEPGGPNPNQRGTMDEAGGTPPDAPGPMPSNIAQPPGPALAV